MPTAASQMCCWSLVAFDQEKWQCFVSVQKPVYPDLSYNQVCCGLHKKCVQGKALTKCRRQIPRLVAASLGRCQKRYTNPKAPTSQQLRLLTSPTPNKVEEGGRNGIFSWGEKELSTVADGTWPYTNPGSIIKFQNHASKGRRYSKIAGAS